MQVRPANLIDISALLVLLHQMHEQHDLPPANWHKVSSVILDNIRSGVVLIAQTDEGEMMGSIGGKPSQDWFTENWHLGDHWFFVRPEHRKSPAAFKLLKAFRKAGQEMNIPVKVAHVLADSVDRMDKFYGKLGFQRSGTLFTEIHDG